MIVKNDPPPSVDPRYSDSGAYPLTRQVFNRSPAVAGPGIAKASSTVKRLGKWEVEEFALEEVVEAFRRIPRGATGFPQIRPADCREVTQALRDYFAANRTRFRTGEPTIQPFFFSLLDRLADSDFRSYPNEVALLHLLRVEALLLAGRHQEALAFCAPLAERPYLIEDDPGTLEKLFELDTLARMNLGRNDEVDAVALGRLLLLVRLRRRSAIRLFRRFFPMLGVGPATPAQYSVLEIPVRLVARFWLKLQPFMTTKYGWLLRPLAWPLSILSSLFLRLMARRSRPLRLQIIAGAGSLGRRPRRSFREAAIRFMASTGRSLRRVLRGDFARASDVLVTRAMGGVGDLMMMTPGLVALSQKLGRPVFFATKRDLFPVMANNPHISLLDIDDTIEMQRFGRWVNLSFCPAGRYESRTRPRVKKGRVELFARAMGINRRHLARYGWQPSCHLSIPQERTRQDRLKASRAAGLPVIGIQPFSRDTYKNCPGLLMAAKQLAEKSKVVLFHGTRVPVDAHQNIVQAVGQSLDKSIAAIADCDYFISIDSAFFHVAAAFDIPSIGIFGPTDGRLCSTHHPRSILIDAAETFACAPCWRNENRPCYLTGNHVSVCLTGINPEQIVARVADLMLKYPLASKKSSTHTSGNAV